MRVFAVRQGLGRVPRGRRGPLLAAVFWLAALLAGDAAAQADPRAFAEDGRVLPVLTSGWYLYAPYEFMDAEGAGTLSGIDIGVAQEVAHRLGYFIDFKYTAWADQIAGIRDGTVDIAVATPTEARKAFAHFSVPFRNEEVVMLVRSELQGQLDGLSAEEILALFKAEELRLGVVEGFDYGLPALNAYVAEHHDTPLIAASENSGLNLHRLLDGEIDALLEDRLAAIDITWKHQAFDQVSEIHVGARSDIALMVSKANFAEDMVVHINEILAEMEAEGRIEEIRKRFLVPLFLSQTTGSTWYWLVDLLGTIAFAMSGTILGWRIGANLAGFFLLSALPTVGGGMMRDILLDREIAALSSAQYITVIAVISGAGYLLYLYHRRGETKPRVSPTFAKAFNFFDALGLGSFTVTGIAVTISDPHQHSIAWAPFIAVVNAAGGGLARDTLVHRTAGVLFDDLYMQISLFWGGLLTLYVALTPTRIDPGQYGVAMWSTVFLIMATRMVWLLRKGRLAAL